MTIEHVFSSIMGLVCIVGGLLCLRLCVVSRLKHSQIYRVGLGLTLGGFGAFAMYGFGFLEPSNLLLWLLPLGGTVMIGYIAAYEWTHLDHPAMGKSR